MAKKPTFWSDDDLPFSCPSGCGCLQPDPDIAGVGVIAAFIAASGLSLLASVVGLWLDLKRPELASIDKNRNRIDQLWLKKWPYNLLQEHKTFWFEVFYPFVLSLSDTQLASGLAVISTGLVRMSKGDLSTYHFNIIQDLAWLANNSHLLSLEVIRRWLVDRQKRSEGCIHQPHSGRGSYFLLRTIRFGLMSIMLGLMLAISIFAGGINTYHYWSCPASCTAFKWPGSTDSVGGQPESWMITNIVLLIWAYVTSMVYLLGPTTKTWMSARALLNRRFKAHISPKFLQYLKWIWDFLGSSLFQTLFQLAWFVIGVQAIAGDWKTGQNMLKHPDNVSDYLQCDPIPAGETGWGFGQIFPIFMLILPLMAFLEAYESQKNSREKSREGSKPCSNCVAMSSDVAATEEPGI